MSDLCSEAVLHQNSLKHFLLAQLAAAAAASTEARGSERLYQDTTVSLADGQLRLNRIYLGLMFPGLGRLADFDRRAELALCLPDFKRSDLLELARRIFLPALRQEEMSTPVVEEAKKKEEELKCGAIELNAAHLSCDDLDTAPPCEGGSNSADLNSEKDPRTECESSPQEEATFNNHSCALQSKRCPWTCIECSATFASRRALGEHRRRDHARPRSLEKNKFPCAHCPNVYTRPDYLKVIAPINQCCGSGSDLNSTGSVDPDPDPGGQEK